MSVERMPFGFFAHSPEPGGNVESGPRVPAWIFRFGELPLKKGHSGKLFKITTARSRHQKFTHPNLNPGRRLASLRSGIIAEKEKLDRTHRKALSKGPFPSVRLHPSMMGLSNRRHFHPRVGMGRRAFAVKSRCHPKARCCFSRNLHPAVFCCFLLLEPFSLPHVVGSPSVALHEALQFGSLVGTVSHRPLPVLPDEEGMARETDAGNPPVRFGGRSGRQRPSLPL